MFKRNHIIKTLLASGLVVTASASLAQDPIDTEASVTVQNAFNFTQNAPLSFGTVRAVVDSDNSDDDGTTGGQTGVSRGAYTVSPDGDVVDAFFTDAAGVTVAGEPATTPGSFTVLTEGTPASYTISGTAPFSNVGFAAVITDVTLTSPSAPPGSLGFTVTDFQYSVGGATPADVATSEIIQTDVTGAITFEIGATLLTSATASTTNYSDGVYSGNFEVTVEYK